MQSIFRSQHVLYGRYRFDSIQLKSQCSLAFGARRGWTPRLRSLSTHHESQSHPGNGSSITGQPLANKRPDCRIRLSAFWTPTGGIEGPVDAKGQYLFE